MKKTRADKLSEKTILKAINALKSEKIETAPTFILYCFLHKHVHGFSEKTDKKCWDKTMEGLELTAPKKKPKKS